MSSVFLRETKHLGSFVCICDSPNRDGKVKKNQALTVRAKQVRNFEYIL
jgi:hypothetical protein